MYREKKQTQEYTSETHFGGWLSRFLIERTLTVVLTGLITIGGLFFGTLITVRALVGKMDELSLKVEAKVDTKLYDENQRALNAQLLDIKGSIKDTNDGVTRIETYLLNRQ